MKDVKTITVPPPQMVANMRVGNMDGFCVASRGGARDRRQDRLHHHHHAGPVEGPSREDLGTTADSSRRTRTPRAR
jgi:hypothetical protein